MENIRLKMQEAFLKVVKTFLLLTKNGHLKWEVADMQALEVTAVAAFNSHYGENDFYLLKKSEYDPQLCIRKKDYVNYPYSFCLKRKNEDLLEIDILSVGSSSIIQEFYETVEVLVEEEKQSNKNKQLKDYIAFLKADKILNEDCDVPPTEVE